MGTSGWRQQIDEILREEGDLPDYLGIEPRDIDKSVETVERLEKLKQTHRNVRAMRTGYKSSYHDMSYGNAPSALLNPGYVEDEFSRYRLEFLGDCVAAADFVLKHGVRTIGGKEADKKQSVEYAIRVYQNAGVLNTRHVKRKLKMYGDRDSMSRDYLLSALRKFSVI